MQKYLDLIVGLDELLKAHLLLQVEAELLQSTEDTVLIRRLGALVLTAAICWPERGLAVCNAATWNFERRKVFNILCKCPSYPSATPR